MKQPSDAPRPATEAPALASPPAPTRGSWRTFSSLRQRNFRLYWFGQMISATGTSMQGIGQAWLTLELTHSALMLGLVGALQSLGVLLFSLFGGVLADRWPKRRILLVTQSMAMAQALALWVLSATGAIQLWHLLLLALLLGLTNALDLPTRQAFVVELVGRDDLPNAVALNSSLGNLARIVGPGLGGVIIAASGVTSLFLLNAVSYLAVLLGLALLDQRTLHAQARPRGDAQQTTWQRLGEGVSYIWRTQALLLVIVVVGLALLFGSNFNVLLPLFATGILHVGAQGFGLLSAALSMGSLLAALWLAWSSQQPTIRRVLTGALAFSVVEAAFAVSRIYPLSLALIAGVGFLEMTFVTLAMTMLQSAAPDHLRGRVVSAYILFFDGSVPVGYLLVGWLSDRLGAPDAMLICACLSLLVVGIGWLWRQRVAVDVAEAARV